MKKAFLPLVALLMLFACSATKPPVEREQYTQLEQETIAAEQEAATLKSQRDGLQRDVKQQQTETSSMRDYLRQLQAEGQ
jgi:septal ring factor EnvC (AmiA/AmiB activator)